MILKDQQQKKVYSDGEVTEQRMLDIAQKYPEDLSQDFIADCSEYTINNTFSSVRQNILNWYPFREHASILEVGAGMGAITGMLCDRAEHVTAIEMSAARADVIKARYGGRSNLKVISENINDWDTDEKFDYIVFIGVLEYAAIFSDNHRPYDEFMLSAKRLLKDDGIILFAIENRFGLKYWLGASEDHLQTPFAGIEGYKESKTARTFSRKELENILDRVGLKNHRFYSVLPDYKFPELIFTDECVPDYMNLKKVSFTYSKNSSLVANEKDLYKDIVENDVFPFFANSFLVEASIKPLEGRYITHVSAKGEVYKDFRVNTVIDNENRVYKIPMHKNAATHIDNIVENTKCLLERGVSVLPVYREQEAIYSEKHNGVPAQKLFRDALENNHIEIIYQLIDTLKADFLKSSNTVEYNINNILVKNSLQDEGIVYGLILQKAYIDMTFYNAFWEQDHLLFFDQEWSFERVPLNFCLYYSIKSAYLRVDVETDISLRKLLEYAEISEDETAAYDRLEDFLWSNVLYRQTDFYGEDGYCNRYCDELTMAAQRKKSEDQFEQFKNELQNEKNALNIKNQNLENRNIDLENKNLDLENRNLDLENRNLDLENKNLNLGNRNLDLENQNLSLENRKLELEHKNLDLQNENADLKQTVLNKEGHIELLLEVERRYEHEKTTHAYKLSKKIQRIGNWFLPLNSRRRFFARIILNMFRHPRLMLHVINPKRIKNYLKYMRLEGMEGVKKRYEEAVDIERMQLDPSSRLDIEIEQVSNKSNAISKMVEDYEGIEFPLYEHPIVSIIIPAYNEFDYTYNCLKSILKNSGDAAYEILIADDCSTDVTKDAEKIAKNVRLITTEKNVKFLLNCNYAARYAKGQYILFLNNDTQVQENWLKPLIDLIERDEKIGMVGSKLVYPDGYLQEAGGIVWNDASAWNYGNRKSPEDPEYNYVKEVDYISGAAIMIRKTLWEELGGFDERFVPAYYEDTDLAFEVRRRGYQVLYQPLSVVVHFEGVSNGTDVESGLKRYQQLNYQKFYDKWKDILQNEHEPNGVNVFTAKDRSNHKKHILVVDHYVPHHDQDAGGKCTYMYLKLFVKMGFQVTFIGDNFYKHEPYTTELNQLGIEVLYGNFYYNNWQQWLKENSHYFDYIYLQRPHISVKYIDLVRQYSQAKVFYFAHDLHHIREYREYEMTKDPEKLESSKRWKEIEYDLFSKADVGHVVGSYEQEIMQKAFPDKPIRNIPLYIYDKILEDIDKDFSERNDLLYVGGFGHPPNADAVLWFAREVYPAILKKYPDMKWHVVGGKVPKEVKELESANIVIEGFVSDEVLEQLYRKCRLAVVPLRFGAGVKGKVVEAAYYQIPLITTSIGAEGLNIEDQSMLVEDDGVKMAEAICEIYEDYDRLRQMSDNGIKFIQKNFMLAEAERVIRLDVEVGK